MHISNFLELFIILYLREYINNVVCLSIINAYESLGTHALYLMHRQTILNLIYVGNFNNCFSSNFTIKYFVFIFETVKY